MIETYSENAKLVILILEANYFPVICQDLFTFKFLLLANGRQGRIRREFFRSLSRENTKSFRDSGTFRFASLESTGNSSSIEASLHDCREMSSRRSKIFKLQNGPPCSSQERVKMYLAWSIRALSARIGYRLRC